MTVAATVTLDDKYVQEQGQVYLSGIQALVKLPMLQYLRDQAAGLNTGGFVSGYRGSPLGGLDKELWRAEKFLGRHQIHFQPGLNEDLAATSIWGTQQIGLFPTPTRDGVFAMWYGKGPGVDRSVDVFKHGNSAGSSPHGGVLVLAGDDHGAKSSTLAHQSEHVFMAAQMPVLNPFPRRWKARPRSPSTPGGACSSSQRISSCPKADCRSAGPIVSSTRKPG